MFLDHFLLAHCNSSQFIASRSGFSLTAAALSHSSSCCLVADKKLKPLKIAQSDGTVKLGHLDSFVKQDQEGCTVTSVGM